MFEIVWIELLKVLKKSHICNYFESRELNFKWNSIKIL
jgi:hypothetical protein